ncbi:MAG: hypothetical protein JRN06_09565 [Nitrososphaerota archaeon]|nr:hypothetical protein [Nitrososphaerota archaeon]MDG7024833.1 hypothetical protein [Nitrososphaerota archaeon]
MSEVRGKTLHGEISIDQIAQIQPGMSALMKEVGDRFTKTYYAAKGGNWKMAAHQLNQLRGAFRTAKVTRPKYADDLEAYDKEYLQPIFKAIHDQDWRGFETAFEKGEEGSDAYHDKRGYPYIRYVLPRDPPSDLYLGPPEKFRRK